MERKLLALDTEDDSKGSVQLLNLFDGKDHKTFYDPPAMREYIRALRPGRLIWAVNLEYDMMNLFKDDLKTFPARIWFGKTRLISFQFGVHLFYDTLNHWKVSVEQMTKAVGGKKQPLDLGDIVSLTRRCQSDCEITFNFVTEMTKRYKKLEAKVKSTLPSTSLELYKSKYLKIPFHVPDTEETDFLKASYFGGRTECFFIGEMRVPKKEKKRIFYIDINSMYPSVMLYDYPHPYYSIPKPRLEAFGVTECLVTCDQDIPVLPVKKDGKLVFPNGTFSGRWNNEELRYAIESGGVKVLKITGGYHYPIMFKPFEAFVMELFTKRRETTDPLMKDTYKLLLNSCYGKFGQGKERKKLITLEKYSRDPSKYPQADGAEIFADHFLIYTEIAEKYPQNTVMIWASYVTAYARIKLHRFITDIKRKGGIPLYCDTDSLLFYGDRSLAQDSKELGAFKIEHELDGVEIKLPKFYRAWHREEIIIERVKGVPRRVQREFFEKGTATFDKPNKFFESLRRGLKMNEWKPVTKQLRGVYDKGVVDNRGFVSPLTINLN